MKKGIVFIVKLFLFLITFCFVSAGPLHAYGVGLYTTGNVEHSLLKTDRNDCTIDGKTNTTAYAVGCGVVYDTAVALDKFFNYRLSVGYENSINSGSPLFSIKSMHKITMANVFGFALFKNKHVRVWAGPQLELACQFGRRTWDIYPLGGSYQNINGYESGNVNLSETTISRKIVSEQIGFGGVLGININTGPLFTLGLEAGINTTILWEQIKSYKKGYTVYLIPVNGSQLYPQVPSKEIKKVIGWKINGLARINFIFRVGDTYIAGRQHITDVKL